MSLRIAHVSATFPPYYGGTGNVCYQNARELANRGHEVHVFTASTTGEREFELLDGIQIQRLQSLTRYGNAHLLPGLITELKTYDLVHLHYPFYGGELTTFGAMLGRTPLVMTYHQDVHLKGPLKYVEWPIRQTLGRLTFRHASRILFTTRDYAGSSYARQFTRHRSQDVDVLPNGVDTQQFHPPESIESVRSLLGLPLDSSILLLVARLDRAHYFKGVDVLLRALTSLEESTIAVIVGEGELRPAYQELAKDLGISTRVIFTGRVPSEDLSRYYQAANVTVLPSTTMGEAFGLVLVESMACETPVVASKLPGVREVVADGIDGLLVEPGNPEDLKGAIISLLDDSDRRRRFGAAGRKKVEQVYDWSQIGQRLEQIYVETLTRTASRTSSFKVDPEWSGE
jgi:glycosyltransferase involved in cell wall biosynthesis